MLDLYSGAKAIWSPQYLAIILMIVAFFVGILRFFSPRAFRRFGYGRILLGYCAMSIGASLLIGIAMARNFFDLLLGVSIAFPVTLIFASIVVLPLVIFLEHIRRCNAISLVSVGVVVSLLLTLIWELRIGPELINGWNRWMAGSPYILILVGGGFLLFCLGARIRFLAVIDEV